MRDEDDPGFKQTLLKTLENYENTGVSVKEELLVVSFHFSERPDVIITLVMEDAEMWEATQHPHPNMNGDELLH